MAVTLLSFSRGGVSGQRFGDRLGLDLRRYTRADPRLAVGAHPIRSHLHFVLILM